MNSNPLIFPLNQELIANRYRLKHLLGRGGMGEVFLADDTLLGDTPVAIKFLSQTIVEAKIQDSFAREALLSAVLSQKSIHIVRAYDYGLSNYGKLYYVMEYLSGKTLKDLIPIDLPLFLTIIRQICLGLHSAHQGINLDGKIQPLIHRDIKPANIMVIPDPILGQMIKILDFGVAKFLNYTEVVTTNKEFSGTLPYCSPEQLEGEELDNRSDIYSLGVMMFEMLTGQKPWQPDTNYFGAWYRAHLFEKPNTIAQISPQLELPDQLNDLIMACINKKRSNRPQSVAKILQVLDKITWELNNQQSSPVNSEKKATLLPHISSGLPVSVEKSCWHTTWPHDKPFEEIVFPHIVDTELGHVTAIWLMLSKQEIQVRTHPTRYNQFVFITTPHPMLMWITVLYNRDLGPKWLPCYLDMQNPYNLKLISRLAEYERYPIIIFNLELPHICANVLSSSIAPAQRQMLNNWVQQSQQLLPSNQAALGKKLLRQQYQQMQPQILQHLESLIQ